MRFSSSFSSSSSSLSLSLFLYLSLFLSLLQPLACKYCEPDACSISFSCLFFIILFTLFFVTHVLAQTQISQRTRKFFSFSLTRLLQHRHAPSPLISKNATMKFSSLFFYILYLIAITSRRSDERNLDAENRGVRLSPRPPSQLIYRAAISLAWTYPVITARTDRPINHGPNNFCVILTRYVYVSFLLHT